MPRAKKVMAMVLIVVGVLVMGGGVFTGLPDLIRVGMVMLGVTAFLSGTPKPKPLTAKEAARGKPVEPRKIGPDGKCSQNHPGDCTRVAAWSDWCVQPPEKDPGPWCTCKSTAKAEPVEVVYDVEKGPEVVAHLCPDCRERRSPKQMRQETEKRAAQARAMTAALALKPIRTDLDLNYHEARKALAERVAVLDVLLDKTRQADDGSFVMTEEQSKRIMAVKDECQRLQEYVTAHKPTSGPYGLAIPHDAGAAVFASAEPSAPVEIEQGGYLYSLGWHVDIEDVCNDDDHEWESIRNWGSATPSIELCTRCAVKRRPTLLKRNRQEAFMQMKAEIALARRDHQPPSF